MTEATEESTLAESAEEIPVALIGAEQSESIVQWIARMTVRAVREGVEGDDDRE